MECQNCRLKLGNNIYNQKENLENRISSIKFQIEIHREKAKERAKRKPVWAKQGHQNHHKCDACGRLGHFKGQCLLFNDLMEAQRKYHFALDILIEEHSNHG